ncbi:MAG: kinase [bacterium]|nr:kinase [bacterium]
MIITRTPYRISFFGGGTDYPAWYKKHGRGAVLSTTINKYCYLNCRNLPPFFRHKYAINYSKRELTKNIQSIKHPSVRESLGFVKSDNGIELHHAGDLPKMSGVGSSSAFTVGLLNALYSLRGEKKTKRELALDAIHVEQNLIGENVGSQDQTSAAFGGLNKIEFGGPKEINVKPVAIRPEKLELLQNNLMLVFTDFSRDGTKIAKHWIKNTDQNKHYLKDMLAMVDEGLSILTQKGKNLDDFGRLLNTSWNIKRKLANNITNGKIDAMYEKAMKNGALGGKLLGAGGGGFILFYAPIDAQPKIKEVFKKFIHVPFKFENAGTQVIHYSTPPNYI